MARGPSRTRTEVYSPGECQHSWVHPDVSTRKLQPSGATTKEQSILGPALLTYAQHSALCPSRTRTGASPPSPTLQAHHCSSAGAPLLRPDVTPGTGARGQALPPGLPSATLASPPTTSCRRSVRLCGGTPEDSSRVSQNQRLCPALSWETTDPSASLRKSAHPVSQALAAEIVKTTSATLKIIPSRLYYGCLGESSHSLIFLQNLTFPSSVTREAFFFKDYR